MAIEYFSEDIEFPKIDTNTVNAWVEKVCAIYNKKPGAITYIFCSDNYLLKINKQYLNHNYYTDIVTFNYCENHIISGDIFISTERVNENAKTYKTSDTELYRVIIHGILHLIGFNDASDEEKAQMRAQEDACLEILFK